MRERERERERAHFRERPQREMRLAHTFRRYGFGSRSSGMRAGGGCGRGDLRGARRAMVHPRQ